MVNPSTYFKNLEKKNSKTKVNTKIKTQEAEVTDIPSIIKEVFNFYSSLYNKAPCDQGVAAEFLSGLPSLSMEDTSVCEGEPTKDECWRAIRDMKDGKSPG